MNALDKIRETAKLQAFGLLKVPLLLFCLPRVERLDDSCCEVKIPLSWRTKNHFRSLYFGALAVGADATAGLLAMRHAGGKKTGVKLLFKDFHAEFLKRADGDTVFRCEDGEALKLAVEKAAKTGERVNVPVKVLALVKKHGTEPVARFELTVSLKKS